MSEADSVNPISEVQIHGTMVQICDVGLIILGDAGTGKSEAALELITRGHKLVADDAIVIRCGVGRIPQARSHDLVAGVLEIRGLGIIHVAEVFGIDSCAHLSDVNLCVELLKNPLDSQQETRTAGTSIEKIGGHEIPKLTIEAKNGGNIPILIETAARIFKSGRPFEDVYQSITGQSENLQKH